MPPTCEAHAATGRARVPIPSPRSPCRRRAARKGPATRGRMRYAPAMLTRLIAWVVFVVLQVAFLPLAVLGVLMVTYRQIVVSRRLGSSATAIEVINGRWTMDWFGMRSDPATVGLLGVLPNSSILGLQLFLFPLWVKHKLSGDYFAYPRLPPANGAETVADLVIVRTLYFDRILGRVLPEVEQFVLLGAGHDTRAYGSARSRRRGLLRGGPSAGPGVEAVQAGRGGNRGVGRHLRAGRLQPGRCVRRARRERLRPGAEDRVPLGGGDPLPGRGRRAEDAAGRPRARGAGQRAGGGRLRRAVRAVGREGGEEDPRLHGRRVRLRAGLREGLGADAAGLPRGARA